jgi:nicotinate-nucleotide pyrophosphorylase (carboxylating)
MKSPDTTQVRQLISRAIAEDKCRQDITTKALIPKTQMGKAIVMAKGSGVIAGTEIAKLVFLKVDRKLKLDIVIKDGIEVRAGDVIAIIKGETSSILKAERVALNFMQRLSGIASETARYVLAVKGLPVYITDTRKTTPALRTLEKYAVRVGGGQNHRMNLADGVLIKDNHIASLRRQGLGIKEIVAKARIKSPRNLKIEVEVRSPEEAVQAVNAGADIIMLDNMNLKDMRQAARLVKGRTLIEASGGVTLENIRAVAETGVDFISIGAITHSPRALDISLELE